MKKILSIIIGLWSLNGLAQQNPGCLVPSTPSLAPDYYCTWNLQGFASPELSKD